MKTIALSAASATLLASCTQGVSVEARRAELGRIADTCGLPRSSLTLDGDRARFEPPLQARYEVVDCVLTKLRQSGLARDLPMGFVGNEAPDTKAGNAKAR